MPFGIRSGGSRDEAGNRVWELWGSVHGKGYFWGHMWGAPLYSMGTLRRTCATVPRRGPVPKLVWANLLVLIVRPPDIVVGGFTGILHYYPYIR